MVVILSGINFKSEIDMFLIILMFEDSLFPILHFHYRFSVKFTFIITHGLNTHIIRLV